MSPNHDNEEIFQVEGGAELDMSLDRTYVPCVNVPLFATAFVMHFIDEVLDNEYIGCNVIENGDE